MGKVIALPSPKAVTVMMTSGRTKNRNTTTAKAVSILFLRMISSSSVQSGRQGI